MRCNLERSNWTAPHRTEFRGIARSYPFDHGGEPPIEINASMYSPRRANSRLSAAARSLEPGWGLVSALWER